jgi:hypothetical protein
MRVRLSALCTGRTSLPRNIYFPTCTHFRWRLSEPSFTLHEALFSIDGWGASLQARKSQVGVLMRLLHVFSLPDSFSCTMALEFTEPQIEVEATLWLTISQYVLVSSPLWDLRPDIASYWKVSVWKLWSCFCETPSPTRGRVCNLQCNHSVVWVVQNP